MKSAAWLGSREALLDIIALDPHSRATVSADSCLRSKLSWYKERLQNGSLGVLIKLYYKGSATLPPRLTAGIKSKENKTQIFL